MHKLFAKQLAKATGPSGMVDLEVLGSLVSTAFKESDIDRRRTDRSIGLMIEELDLLNRNLEKKVADRTRKLNQHKAELLAQNRHFDAALDNMSQGLCMFDGEQRLIVANKHYAQIYGFSAELLKPGITLSEILKHRIAEGIYSGEGAESYIEERLAWVAMRDRCSKIQRLSDGRYIEIIHQPLPAGGWVDTHEDITDRKMIEAELVEHRDHLQEMVNESTAELQVALAKEQELNGIQRQLVSMVSHEFRTPLAIIDAVAQRMTRKIEKGLLSPEDATGRAEKIRAAVQRMTRLMESTLSAARMQEGKIKIEIEPCDIGKLVNEVCERQQEVADEHVITCGLAELPETIQADTGLLDQILTNLLSNAVKYAPDNPEIEVRARVIKDDVAISVRDHGVGIDEEDLPNMFGRFFRAKTSAGIPGTGIGLNLVKNLVEMHSGSINLESNKGEGSTFTIRLPIGGPDVSQRTVAGVA